MSNKPSIVSIIDRNDLGSLFLSNDDQNKSKLLPIIEFIEKEARAIVHDVTTDEGKKGIKSLAFNVAKAKTAIDAAGKEKKAELSVEINIIDSLRNMSKTRLQELQTDIRQPLTDIENADKERKLNIEARLEWLSSAGNATMSSDELIELIGDIEGNPIDDSWDEYKADAINAYESTLDRLKSTYHNVLQAEEDKAELKKLRAMTAEFERREAEQKAADRARAEAEAKAEAKAEQIRLDHIRDMEAQAAREQAIIKDHQRQLDEQERQRQEAADRENQRIADIEAKAQQEAQDAKYEAEQLIINERREAEAARKDLEIKAQQAKDEAEKRKNDEAIRNQAIADSIEDLIAGGIPKTHASKVIKLIMNDKVVNLSMNF